MRSLVNILALRLMRPALARSSRGVGAAVRVALGDDALLLAAAQALGDLAGEAGALGGLQAGVEWGEPVAQVVECVSHWARTTSPDCLGPGRASRVRQGFAGLWLAGGAAPGRWRLGRGSKRLMSGWGRRW